MEEFESAAIIQNLRPGCNWQSHSGAPQRVTQIWQGRDSHPGSTWCAQLVQMELEQRVAAATIDRTPHTHLQQTEACDVVRCVAAS
jgi:hypothetical protein